MYQIVSNQPTSTTTARLTHHYLFTKFKLTSTSETINHHIRVKHYIDNKIIAIIPRSPFPHLLTRETAQKQSEKKSQEWTTKQKAKKQARGSQPISQLPKKRQGRNIHSPISVPVLSSRKI
jgi:hypothetical protein